MTSINQSQLRIGNITSSEIVALVSNGTEKGSVGKPFKTYVDECNVERRLLRSISDESNARALVWGKVCEPVAFNKLGIEYILCSSQTIVHESISCWVGSPDGRKLDEGKTVIDIKCPLTLKSYCTMYDCENIEQVRKNHKDGEKYYWQLVSNAILEKAKYAELILFMPFLDELEEIRGVVSGLEQSDLYKAFWIANGNDEELPHLLRTGEYNNIKIIRFEVPQADKDLLTQRVHMAKSKLIPFYKSKL